MPELIPSPHQPSKGMGADGAKYLQAVSIAQSTGKSVEEVLAFMGVDAPVNAPAPIPAAPAPVAQTPEVSEEEFIPEVTKPKAAPKPAKAPEDGFYVTEEVDPKDATEQDLAKLAAQEADLEDYSGIIREGSIVKVVYQPSGGRGINWKGRKGKVKRIIGNEHAKIYVVEFAAGKVPAIRLNKKTGKLEKGYNIKKLENTFDVEDIELAD